MPYEINGTEYEAYVVSSDGTELIPYDTYLGDGTVIHEHGDGVPAGYVMLDEPSGSFATGWNDTSGWTAYDGYASSTSNYPTGLRWGENRFSPGQSWSLDVRRETTNANLEIQFAKNDQPHTSGNGYVLRVYSSGVDIYEMSGGDFSGGYLDWISRSSAVGEWVPIEVDWADDGSEFTVFVGDESTTIQNNHSGTLGGWSYVGNYSSDGEEMRVRNLISEELEPDVAVTTDSATSPSPGEIDTTGSVSTTVISSADAAFDYREQGTSTWSQTATQSVSDGTYSDTITGLNDGTTYEVRATATADYDGTTYSDTGSILTATTESTTNWAVLDDFAGSTFDAGWADTTDWTAYDGYAKTTVEYPGGLVWGAEEFGAGDRFQIDYRWIDNGNGYGFAVTFGKSVQSVSSGSGYTLHNYASGIDAYEMSGGATTATYITWGSASPASGTWLTLDVDWTDTSQVVVSLEGSEILSFANDHADTLGAWSWITQYTASEVDVREVRVYQG